METLNNKLEIPNFYYPYKKDNKLRRRKIDSPSIQKDPESDCDDESVSVIKDPVFIRDNRKMKDPPLSEEDKLNPRNNSVVLQLG